MLLGFVLGLGMKRAESHSDKEVIMGKASRRKRRRSSESEDEFIMNLSHQDEVMLMVMMHFPHAQCDSDLMCGECEDLHSGACSGEGRRGAAVIECMRDKVLHGEGEWGFVG